MKLSIQLPGMCCIHRAYSVMLSHFGPPYLLTRSHTLIHPTRSPACPHTLIPPYIYLITNFTHTLSLSALPAHKHIITDTSVLQAQQFCFTSGLLRSDQVATACRVVLMCTCVHVYTYIYAMCKLYMYAIGMHDLTRKYASWIQK